MNSTPEQLRFASTPGCSIRANFAGGGLSSDLGPLLKGVDRQIGLTERVCAAISDTRHPDYITHSLHDILKQRIYQIASGYGDGTPVPSFVLLSYRTSGSVKTDLGLLRYYHRKAA